MLPPFLPPSLPGPAYLIGNEESLALQLVGFRMMHYNHLGWLIQGCLQCTCKYTSVWIKAQDKSFRKLAADFFPPKKPEQEYYIITSRRLALLAPCCTQLDYLPTTCMHASEVL